MDRKYRILRTVVYFTAVMLLTVTLFAEQSPLDRQLSAALKDFEAAAEEVTMNTGLGPITAGENGSGTEFSEYLRGRLSDLIASSERLELIERERMELVIDEMKLALSGLTEDSDSPQPGELSAVEAFITGYYLEEGTDVRIFLRLVMVDTALTSVALDFTLPKASLPRGVALKTDNYRDAERLLDELSSVTGKESPDFQVRLWTARGDGSVYVDGEEFIVKFFANRDCYLRIYHVDVNGRTQMIFPNPYSAENAVAAGRIYTIPGSGYPFKFILGKPYGVEYIKAVASTRPFEDDAEAFTDLGSASRGLVSRGLTVTARETLLAEAMTSYTIVEGR